ncbi:MAG TPA: exosortase E/protease, VPEID-CTERM system [Bryobacteraceae bacterium]|nr:exosortase E/protease, VPEID-CTERM system [Bryobacteraceae bacterium]
MSRLFALALVFSLELIVISIWVDGAALMGGRGLAAFAHDWGAWIIRAVVGFAALFATFTWLQNKATLAVLSDELTRAPIGWAMAAAHIGAMACFLFLSWLIYAGGFGGVQTDAALACWLAAGILAIGLAGLAAMPSFAWRRLVLTDRYLWVYAALAASFACIAGNQVRALWAPTSYLTFFLTKAVLKPFASVVIADPAAMTLGTPRFLVQISPECSGFEGAGLIAAFGVVWLIVFRKDCRWPQSLLLIPAGVAVLFLLNAARIAALILIGDGGAARIATGGFHSQAGWIAFNFVALGFSIAAREMPWFTLRARASNERATVENPVTPWVLPIVAVLAAGMVASALTGDFEWFYPLRFLAAAGALWYCRRSYRALDWRFGWEAPAVGALVFVLWIARDLLSAPGSHGMPPALAASSAEPRMGWLAIRVISAVVTVPIAEELAFRGFLMRRLIAADFESVPMRRLSWMALLVSSLLFGLLHGNRWVEGTAAGLLYGMILLRQGRIGDAVAAHATTNALLAIYVLAFHQWQLW